MTITNENFSRLLKQATLLEILTDLEFLFLHCFTRVYARAFVRLDFPLGVRTFVSLFSIVVDDA